MRKVLVLFSMLFLFAISVIAQTRNVTGRVTDEKGNPVPFASIKVKNSKTGVAADASGAFTIRAGSGDVLVVSSSGFTSKEVSVGTDNNINISITQSSQELTSVVVTTALGIQRQAKELGYATSKINNQTLTQAKVTDISTGLQGKVAGLQVNLVNNSVDPNTRIVLRGNRSITGNNQALLVIDGVPIDNTGYITKIDPEDVDNVTVLKGAVAAAIYGSKASNGVLIITTKHGTRGKPTITVGNTVNLESISYLPKLQTTFGSYGGEGGSYVNANGTVNYVPYENEAYGPPYNGATVPLAISPVFKADGVTVDHFDTLYSTYSPKNGIRDFFNTGLSNQFDMSYSAGDERGTFYLGAQDVNTSGVIPKDKFRRDNIRIGGSRDYGRFHADYTVSYNQSNVDIAGTSYNQNGSGGVFGVRPLYFELLNTPAWIPITDFKDWQNNVYASPDGYYNAYATNPYWTIDNSRRKTTTYDILGNINLSFKITDWLNVSDRLGVTQSTSQLKYTRAGITFAPWAVADPWGAGNVPSSFNGYLAPAEYDETFMEQRINNDLLGSFQKDFGNFSVKGLVGFNVAQRYQRDINLEGDNLQFPGDYNIGSVLGVPGYGEASYKQREFSIYEDVTVGYKEYLFLHLTNRDEWNSLLNPSLWHSEYPGGDVSFIFTQAINSLKGNRILSYGKIRGGVTKVANINLSTNPYGAYSLQNPFVVPAGFPFGSIGGYTQSGTYLNPVLQPELTTEYEVGAELGFLNNRIYITGDYYQSKSKNENLTAVISAATGFTNKLVNAGLVSNKGVEVELNVIPVKSKNVTWNVGINYAHYINRIDDLLPGVDQLQLSGFNGGVGGGIYAVKGLPYPVIEANDWVRDSLGRVIVDPVNGRPSVDPTAKVFGTTNPTDILGITTSVSWKGFTLSAVADYRAGNYIMNSVGAYLDFTGVSYHSAENGRQRFIFPNSVILEDGKYVPNTNVAVDNGGNTANHGFWPDLVYGTNIGSIYVTSAAFWKLREVSLTYQIPTSVLARVNFIKKASIGLVGRNLLMLRPKSNIWTDPEFSDTNGNDVGRTSEYQTPPTRIYGANITLTF